MKITEKESELSNKWYEEARFRSDIKADPYSFIEGERCTENLELKQLLEEMEERFNYLVTDLESLKSEKESDISLGKIEEIELAIVRVQQMLLTKLKPKN